MDAVKKPITAPHLRTNVAGHATADPIAAVSITRGISEAWARLPAIEPDLSRLRHARVLTCSDGPEATPFDLMRTRTLQTMRRQGWRRLAITSPQAGCGKSTLALNLAFSLGRQRDIRTILCELDLRRPVLGSQIGYIPDHGVDEVLKGELAFANQAVCYNTNLAFALGRGSVKHSAELLQSHAMGDHLSWIDNHYAPDITIFDTPPMLASDDMMALASQVDCVLIVAGAETTTIDEIEACERELASQTNVMGVTLNKCRYMLPRNGYRYTA